MYLLKVRNGVLEQKKVGNNIVYLCKYLPTGEIEEVNNTWVRKNIQNIENAVIENGKVVFGTKKLKQVSKIGAIDGFYKLIDTDTIDMSVYSMEYNSKYNRLFLFRVIDGLDFLYGDGITVTSPLNVVEVIEGLEKTLDNINIRDYVDFESDEWDKEGLYKYYIKENVRNTPYRSIYERVENIYNTFYYESTYFDEETGEDILITDTWGQGDKSDWFGDICSIFDEFGNVLNKIDEIRELICKLKAYTEKHNLTSEACANIPLSKMYDLQYLRVY